MLTNNKTICLVIVCHDLHVKKIYKFIWGADSAYPFCDVNRGRWSAYASNRRLSNARRQQTYRVNFHCLRSSEHAHNSENNGFTR